MLRLLSLAQINIYHANQQPGCILWSGIMVDKSASIEITQNSFRQKLSVSFSLQRRRNTFALFSLSGKIYANFQSYMLAFSHRRENASVGSIFKLHQLMMLNSKRYVIQMTFVFFYCRLHRVNNCLIPATDVCIAHLKMN